MNTFNKYMVMTEVELDNLRQGMPWESMELEAAKTKTGKKLKLTDIYGKAKVEQGKTDPNKGATYSLRTLINNPAHADYGSYYISVNQTDVETHLGSYVSRLVDYDPTWRVEE